MQKKRPKRTRAPHYTMKGVDVLLSVWAVELSEATKENGDDLTQREIKDEIIRRLHSLADDIGRIGDREPEPDKGRRWALSAARLVLGQEEPDLIAAQRAIRGQATHLGTLHRSSWDERLKALLEGPIGERDLALGKSLRTYLDMLRELWRGER